MLGHGAQHVQGGDVAGALPDRDQRRLPVEPGHAGLLDVAVAAQALQGLGGVRRTALADPVLGDGQAEPADQRLLTVPGEGGVGGLGEPHRHGGGRLGLHHEVGEHIAHQRLVDQRPAERPAVQGVLDCPGGPEPHPGGGADGAVQAGRVDHLDDGPHPAALLADQQAVRLLVLDLGGGVGLVAELVLEPLEAEPVAAAVRQHARQQEAAEPARRLGEGEEEVGHRRRGEPLVAGEPVAPVGLRDGGRGVGADVRAALLLGHRHAGDQTALAVRLAQSEVVLGGGEQRFELGGQRGRGAQRGNGGVGHRDRAGVAGLDLAPDVELGGAGGVRAGPVVPPGGGVQAVPDGGAHQLVPVRVELDLVDPVAEAVVGAQHRRILVGQPPPLGGLLGAGQPAEGAQFGLGPAGAGPVQGSEQRGVGGGVVPVRGRGLVGDLMRRCHRVLQALGG